MKGESNKSHMDGERYITKGNINAKYCVILPVARKDSESISVIYEGIKNQEEEVLLVGYLVDDWNSQLSPWRAKGVFAQEEFGGNAGDTLWDIENNIICNLTNSTDTDRKYIIAGYSLAGLFALFSAYETDRFYGVAAVSPSVWYEGFLEYSREKRIKAKEIVLSLGDREEKTKNQIMAKVGNNLKAIYENISATEGIISCKYQMNPGGHFKDVEKRIIRALQVFFNENKKLCEKEKLDYTNCIDKLN